MSKYAAYGALVVAVLALVLSAIGNMTNVIEDGLGSTTQASWTAADLISNDDLTVTDDATIGGDLTVTDDATIGGDLDVDGASTVDTFTEGGGVISISTAEATATALESYFDTENILVYTPNVDSTLTLPATSTITDWISNAGDTRVTYIQNASSTAASVLTLAAGAGIDIQEPTGGAALTIEGLDWARITWTRLSNSDVLVIVDELQEGD